jgi:hypothetical protein
MQGSHVPPSSPVARLPPKRYQRPVMDRKGVLRLACVDADREQWRHPLSDAGEFRSAE